MPQRWHIALNNLELFSFVFKMLIFIIKIMLRSNIMPSIFFYFSVFYEEKTFGEKICGKQTPKVFSLKHNYEERIILRFFPIKATDYW